jgi:Beta-galactosidase
LIVCSPAYPLITRALPDSQGSAREVASEARIESFSIRPGCGLQTPVESNFKTIATADLAFLTQGTSMNPLLKLRHISFAAVIVSAALLSACGGGSDEAMPSESKQAAGLESASFAAANAAQPLKWNPGHYAVVSAHNANQIERILGQIDKFPFVKGIVLRTSWVDTETEKDTYDFTALDAGIERAVAHGKRVFIMMGTKSFDVDDKAVPDYMRTSEYGGGAYAIEIKRGGYGENAKLWNVKTRDRLIALNQALATRYNTNNNVEGLIFNETALGMAVRPISTAQYQKYFDNLATINIAAKAAFQNSTVIQYMNAPMKYVPTLWSTITANKVGAGGPDVYLEDLSLAKLLPSYVAAAGNVPIGVQVEPASFRSTVHAGPFNPPAVTDLYEFARSKMFSNYIFWVPDMSEPHTPWPKVLEMFDSASFPKDATGGLPSACPLETTCVEKL